MYDTKTRSWWNQLFGRAISGPMKGKKLVKLPYTMTTWKKWRDMHPETTAYIKSSVPYHQQSDFSAEYFASLAEKGDGPVENTDLVIGVEGHVEARAYLVRYLARKRVINDALEGHPIVVFLSEDLATARILDRSIGRRSLTFSLTQGDLLSDDETGSVWDPMTGQALSGPMKGKRLNSYVSTYSLWFAWKKYRSESELVGAP